MISYKVVGAVGKAYVWFGTPAKGAGFPGGPLCVATVLEAI